MNLDIKDIQARSITILQYIKQYSGFMFVITMLSIFGFLVFRINSFAQSEPSSDAVQQKLQSIQRPKVDQSALNKIQQLQDQNVQVQSLFDQARNNPFNEQPGN